MDKHYADVCIELLANLGYLSFLQDSGWDARSLCNGLSGCVRLLLG